MSGVFFERQYRVIDELRQEGITVAESCRALGISRSSYYKWKHRKKSARQQENEVILAGMRVIYYEFGGIYGYSRIADEYNMRHHTAYSKKRFHRLARIAGLKSVIGGHAPEAQRQLATHIAENILGMNFRAERPNEKWLTDITQMRVGSGAVLYLSAILDLLANDIVAYAVSPYNDNQLVFTTFDIAIAKYPDAHPLVHSDRGSQYTSLQFKRKLDAAGMTHSMSRPGKCMDNAPMEAFWGMLKNELYHLYTFDDFDSLARAIDIYIDFYNNRRRQHRLDRLPPLVYRALFDQQN